MVKRGISNSPCRAKNKKGGPCRAPASAGGYCFSHDPERAAERDAARSRGGIKRMAQLSTQTILNKLDPATKIEDLADGQRLLAAILIEVINTATTARFTVGEKGRTIATLWGVFLKGLEVSEKEQKFAEGLRELKELKAEIAPILKKLKFVQ